MIVEDDKSLGLCVIDKAEFTRRVREEWNKESDSFEPSQSYWDIRWEKLRHDALQGSTVQVMQTSWRTETRRVWRMNKSELLPKIIANPLESSSDRDLTKPKNEQNQKDRIKQMLYNSGTETLLAIEPKT